MKPVVIYHHPCTDGSVAAWVAHRAFRGACDLHPTNYGHEPPDVTGRTVYILDFSYPRETLVEMHKQAESLVVLDHHKTAAEALKGLDFAVFDMNKSGARLAWEHFYPGTQPPALVLYAEDRDLWRFSLPKARAISAWMRTMTPSMDRLDTIEQQLANPQTFKRCAAVGVGILRGQAQTVKTIAARHRPVMLAEIQFATVCNADTALVSEITERIAKDTQGPAASWYVIGGFAYWRLTSTGEDAIDVSAVAKIHGGGGHYNAAGFKVTLAEHFGILEGS